MKLKEVIKKQTLLIVLTVTVVALTTIGVSYAVFFDVKRNTKDQVITAGTLKITLSASGTIDWSEPRSDEEGKGADPLKYTVQNTDSSLPASYTVYIYAADGNTVPFDLVKFSTDGVETKVLGSQDHTDEDISGVNRTIYKIESGNVAAGGSLEKTLHLWVSDTMEEGEFMVKLNLYIVSEVDEDQVNS
ncbi:MAG: hypothetical protein NC483_07210 [Ruminococcus sp.]|nr:hypothetical protein [Ruminococcus sp.]